MLTRSQTAVVNNFFKAGEKPSTVPRNGTKPVATMCTRSQTKLMSDKVDIDFDGASREWRKNKRSTGNGTYEYRPSH